MSLAHVFLPDGGAQSIATIPPDGFTANCAAAVIHVFSLWGLSQLLIGLIYVVVLWRFQAWIPLVWLLSVIEYGGRLLLASAKPFEIRGTAPGATESYVLIPLALLRLALSGRERRSVWHNGSASARRELATSYP